MRTELVNNLIGVLYQSVLDEPYTWRSFLRALREYSGLDSTSIAYLEHGQLVYDVADVSWQMAERDWQQRWDKIMQVAAFNPLNFTLHFGENSNLLNSADLPEDLRCNNRWYREYFQPIGVEHQLIMTGKKADRTFLISCLKKRETGPITEDHEQLLTALRPHLTRAWEIQNRLSYATAGKEFYETTVDRFHLAAFMLNAHGKILSQNRKATELLVQLQDIGATQGALHFKDATDNRDFRRLVVKAQAWLERPDQEKPSCVMKVDMEDGRELAVTVVPLAKNAVGEQPGGPRIAVYVWEIGDQRKPSPELIAQLFDLRLSEAKLAILLANGYTAADAAEELGISVGNARTTATRLYPKAGAEHRGDLALRILNCAALLS